MSFTINVTHALVKYLVLFDFIRHRAGYVQPINGVIFGEIMARQKLKLKVKHTETF